jgi:EAL domain-containing protein (putative c-di-GMP-specific phosphodiesterase class I)
VDLGSGGVHGAEALVRWNHPVRGLVMPDVFVPLAEATGSMGALTRWVLTESARRLREWRDTFPDAYPLTMDVNISATQLSDDRILSDLVDVLEQTGVDPAGLVLEITESALMRDVETGLRRLRQIAAIGVNLALDDFGTGYSSLAHLRRLPISVLKIDKAFISGVSEATTDDAETAMLRGIVGLGASLGMVMVAEGVETAAHETVLRDLGCHLGQGYRYSTPLTAAEFTRVLEASRHTHRWPVTNAPHGIPSPR